MGKKRTRSLHFPIGGLHTKFGYQRQPPFTTPDCLNVRPLDSLPQEGRERGGQRPGTEKTFDELLGSGNKVVLLNSFNIADPGEIPGTVQSENYFVDATLGDDAFDGLSGTDDGGGVGPWQTLAKVSAASFSPGDTIHFKIDEVWGETLTLTNQVATASNPITIKFYGGIGDPSDWDSYWSVNDPPRFQGGVEDKGIHLTGCSYINVFFIRCIAMDTAGFHCENSPHCQFTYCSSAAVGNAWSDEAVNFLFSGTSDHCSLRECAAAGISGLSAGYVFTDSATHGSVEFCISGNEGCQRGGFIADTSNCYFHKCICNDNSGIISSGNEVYSYKGGFVATANGSSSTFNKCTVTEGDTHFDAMPEASILIEAGATFVFVINCTTNGYIDTIGDNASISIKGDNAIVYDNIFYNPLDIGNFQTVIKLAAGLDLSIGFLDYNCFFADAANTIRFTSGATNYASIAAWRAGEGFDANSIEDDPDFVNPGNTNISDLQLLVGSPAIGTGRYGGNMGSDFDGSEPRTQ